MRKVNQLKYFKIYMKKSWKDRTILKDANDIYLEQNSKRIRKIKIKKIGNLLRHEIWYIDRKYTKTVNRK